MASNALQVVGFVLGVMAWVGMIGTCAAPQWRKNSLGQTVIDNTLRYDGLWLRCKAFSTGQTQCDPYTSFFIGLPEVLQICRALMISSIGIGFIATLVTIFGLKCVNAGCGTAKVKSRISLIGGLLYGVAGGCNAATVYFAYFWAADENYDVMKGFYVAMASSVVGMIASSLLVIGSVTSCADDAIEKKSSRTFSFRRGSYDNRKLARREERRACALGGGDDVTSRRPRLHDDVMAGRRGGTQNPMFMADYV